jgi:sugar O-acyltransferase (sialic acid O-acetyltransferase NeuD family)
VSAKPLVIFGTGDIAELAHHYFTTDAKRQVEAFTVDRPYVGRGRFCGLPVVPFEEIAVRFPPASHELFVAVSYAGLNSVRKEKYLAAKMAGYTLPSYVSSKATVLNGGAIGGNCFILEDNTIQPFVAIGNNVTLWSGNHIGHHSKIRDHCFLASHIVISGGVEIGESCFIGVNATVRDHISVGERCVIGAGALLLADAEPEGVYMAEATERSRVPSGRLKKI